MRRPARLGFRDRAGVRQQYDDRRVTRVIRNDEEGSYRRAALAANTGPYDVVSLQHEFGLYPGAWGRGVLDFVTQCRKPIITTLHTLLSTPPTARDIIDARTAKQGCRGHDQRGIGSLLRKAYGSFSTPIRVIPHGVPIIHRQYDAACKKRLDLVGRRVLITFGLIGRGKGLSR